ncbi:MAG: hypothetical protein LBT18_03490 [Endomicrobium sp.]|jgi:2-isopropylmalate synthase|nr:hypothetical protein [Endomicrobium sp.]
MLKARETYEIMRSVDVGVPESSLVLGKHSGRHAFFKKVKDLGYKLDAKASEKLFEKFKVLSDKKKLIFDDDIVALVEEDTTQGSEVFTLDYLNVTSGAGIPTATVKISKKQGDKNAQLEIFQEAACGSGPIDVVYKVVDKIVKMDINLAEFSLRAVSSGEDALGEVFLKVKYNGSVYSGKRTSTDIIEA